MTTPPEDLGQVPPPSDDTSAEPAFAPPSTVPPPPPGYQIPGPTGAAPEVGVCSAGHQMAPGQRFCAVCGAPRASGVVYVQAAPAPRTNGFAIASLVLGIVWIYGIGAVLALIFGLVARNQIDKSEGAQRGKGLALAGIILGIVGIVGIIAMIVTLVALAHNVTHLRPYNIHSDGTTGLTGD
jgi:hypothetical protein